MARLLGGYKFHYGNEDDLQRGIEEALTAIGVSFTREAQIDAGRIDFLVHTVHEVGIEVKVDGAAPTVASQCARYLKDQAIDGLVLVTTRRRHKKLWFPGKPFEIVWLGSVAF